MSNRSRGIRLQIVSASRVDVAVQNANAEADKIEEGNGYIHWYNLVSNGDKHYILIGYVPDLSSPVEDYPDGT